MTLTNLSDLCFTPLLTLTLTLSLRESEQPSHSLLFRTIVKPTPSQVLHRFGA